MGTLSIDIFESKENALFNKILEKRLNYLTEFCVEPKYVVIPVYYHILIEEHKLYRKGKINNTFYGMLVIESRNCKTIDDVMVY